MVTGVQILHSLHIKLTRHPLLQHQLRRHPIILVKLHQPQTFPLILQLTQKHRLPTLVHYIHDIQFLVHTTTCFGIDSAFIATDAAAEVVAERVGEFSGVFDDLGGFLARVL